MTYLLPIAVSLAITTDPNDYSDGTFPHIADSMGWGRWISWIMLVGALTSNFGTYQVYLHTSSTALYSMSLSGDAPPIFKRTLPKFDTPWVAITFFSITTALWCLFDFSVVVEVETVLYCLHVCVLITTFFRLRFIAPDMERPFRFRGPLWLLMPLCAFPCSIAIFNISITNWFATLMGLGMLTALATSFWIKKIVTAPDDHLGS